MPWYIHLLFWYSCWWSPLTICKIGFDMFTLYFKCTSGFQGGFMRLLKEIGFIIFCTTGYNLRCGLCEFLMMNSVEGINAVLWCNIWDRFSRLLNGLRTPEMNSNQSGAVGEPFWVHNRGHWSIWGPLDGFRSKFRPFWALGQILTFTDSPC